MVDVEEFRPPGDEMQAVTVLLGAGASVEAGIPASADMTKAIAERIQQKRILVASGVPQA